MSSSFRATW